MSREVPPMGPTEARSYQAAAALWALWALHVYFDALMFRCVATGALAALVTVAAAVQSISRDCP